MSQADLPLLLEPEALALALQQNDAIVLLDLCHPDRYPQQHLPGARYVHPSHLQCGIAPAPGRLPDEAHLHELLSDLGLKPTDHVVAYDDEGGGWAARMLWTLEVLGHRSYSYLNGGIHAWAGAGLPLSSEPVAITASDYPITLHRADMAEVEDILPRLDDPQLKIWDARSPEEYRGERSAAARAGHIPGAINIDWLELIDRSRDTRLVDLDALQERLNQLGLSADRDIITHCQTHHRSSLTWLVMKVLGYPSVKGYHGSWGEWGNRDDTPIEA